MGTLGQVPNTEVFRFANLASNLVISESVLACRADGPLFFGSCGRVFDWIRAQVGLIKPAYSSMNSEAPGTPSPFRQVVLDMGPVPYIDATAIGEFAKLMKELDEHNVALVISNACNRVLQALDDAGMPAVALLTACLEIIMCANWT